MGGNTHTHNFACWAPQEHSFSSQANSEYRTCYGVFEYCCKQVNKLDNSCTMYQAWLIWKLWPDTFGLKWLKFQICVTPNAHSRCFTLWASEAACTILWNCDRFCVCLMPPLVCTKPSYECIDLCEKCKRKKCWHSQRKPSQYTGTWGLVIHIFTIQFLPTLF